MTKEGSISRFTIRSISGAKYRCRRLRHAEGEAAIDRRAHRDLAQETAIDTDDGHDPEVAAALDRLAQHMRPVGAQHGGDLHAVDDQDGGRRVRLGADCVDEGIGAAAYSASQGNLGFPPGA